MVDDGDLFGVRTGGGEDAVVSRQRGGNGGHGIVQRVGRVGDADGRRTSLRGGLRCNEQAQRDEKGNDAMDTLTRARVIGKTSQEKGGEKLRAKPKNHLAIVSYSCEIVITIQRYLGN